jgi:hypothetical protein
LIIKSIPKDVPIKTFNQMFPDGIVELKSDGKGGTDCEIEFQNFNDARMAFRNALKGKLKGNPISILPRMRLPGEAEDLERGSVNYANPYMIKSVSSSTLSYIK